MHSLWKFNPKQFCDRFIHFLFFCLLLVAMIHGLVCVADDVGDFFTLFFAQWFWLTFWRLHLPYKNYPQTVPKATQNMLFKSSNVKKFPNLSTKYSSKFVWKIVISINCNRLTHTTHTHTHTHGKSQCHNHQNIILYT